MIINGLNDQTVEIRITNYQFPNETQDEWDGNWLNIYLKVKSDLGNWQTIDPSLTTWEMNELIDWFNMLSKDIAPKHLRLNFTEPNLSFELLKGRKKPQKMFRISFNLESRPQSAKDSDVYFVDCFVENQELKRIADELKMELDKYPER